MKRPSKLHHIEAHDECGDLVREKFINERIMEGLMRGESPYKERQWWGVKPNRYKIMSDGSLKYEKK